MIDAIRSEDPIRSKIEALGTTLSLPTVRKALGILEGAHASDKRFGPVGVMTDYEAKFHAQGFPINRVVAVKTEATKGMAAGPAPRMYKAALTDAHGYEDSMNSNAGEKHE